MTEGNRATSSFPRPVFFYGTLSLPHVLQNVLALPKTPELSDAYVHGWKIKMSGPYPALVATDDVQSITHGKVWMMPGGDEGHSFLRRLEQYETENYKKLDCLVYVGDSRQQMQGITFKWNSYPEDLEDGVFDPSKFPASDQSEPSSLSAQPPIYLEDDLSVVWEGETSKVISAASHDIPANSESLSTSPASVFFYGTLGLPHILQGILQLPERPVLNDAAVYGWKLRMWGPYPALVPVPAEPESITKGKAWFLPDGEEGRRHLERLDRYETENYRRIYCKIRFMNGGEWRLGHLYKWNSYPEELQDGAFDASKFPDTTD